MSGDPLPARRWSRVTVPTLVVDGRASRQVMRGAAGVPPDARRRTLAGQDHAVAPPVLVPVLTEFFAG